MTKQTHHNRLGLLSLTLLLLFAWPPTGQAQLSSYGNTVVFKNPEIRNVTLHPVSPDSGESIDNAPPIDASISPDGELTIGDSRYGLEPEKFEVALKPGRYLIMYGFALLPVYLDFDGTNIAFSVESSRRIPGGDHFLSWWNRRRVDDNPWMLYSIPMSRSIAVQSRHAMRPCEEST